MRINRRHFLNCISTLGDASDSGKGVEEDSLRGGELFLMEKFGEVEDFGDLAFWQALNQLMESFAAVIILRG